jgi:hypothetical protein
MIPYQPRHLAAHGVESREGWRLKRYAISLEPGGVAWPEFAPGLALAWDALPQPAQTEGRPGVGFVIAHRGRGADYLVIGWWDRENEMPVRVFVKPTGEAGFRAARGGESFCVWDLRVIAAERDAYVATVLSPQGADVEGYLQRWCAADSAPTTGGDA